MCVSHAQYISAQTSHLSSTRQPLRARIFEGAVLYGLTFTKAEACVNFILKLKKFKHIIILVILLSSLHIIFFLLPKRGKNDDGLESMSLVYGSHDKRKFNHDVFLPLYFQDGQSGLALIFWSVFCFPLILLAAVLFLMLLSS